MAKSTQHSILKGTCQYFTKPMALMLRHDIPKDSPVWWRYDMLLAVCWEQTKTEYGDIELSNEQLAQLWATDEETARKGLAQMRAYKMVTTYQQGRTQRKIRLLFAWRGQGKDGAPATNQPETRALRLDDQAPAAGVPTQQIAPCAEGGKQTPTLDGGLNVVVGTNLSIDSKNTCQQQPGFDNPGCTLFEGGKQTPTIENEGGKQIRMIEDEMRIIDALWDLDIVDSRSIDVILGKIPEMFRWQPRDYSNVTPEMIEDWVLHRRMMAKRGADDLIGAERDAFTYALGAGYYIIQLREKRESPYRMSDSQRQRYRALWDAGRNQEVKPAAEGDADRVPEEIEPELVGKQPSPHNNVGGDSLYRRDGTESIWAATLGELQLQMTKATFDTLVRPSHAMGWDADGKFIVGVHSAYAKEWLENRLQATIQRTVTGIVGKPVTIKYVVHEKYPAAAR